MSLNRLGIDPNQIDVVVLSHHHGHHFLGLPFLLLRWKYAGRTRPIHIVGPPETMSITAEVTRRTYPTLLESPAEVHWREVRPGERIEVAGLELEPVEVVH